MNATGGALLIYGANGYTGRLVVKRAVSVGLKPILCGRNTAEISAIAGQHGLEFRIASLGDPASLDAALAGCSVVIHSAGPFSRTSKPMVDACIRNRVHYLDITGEISVFESLASSARSAEARAAGIMLLPGAGFDVVPSDCLAAHLKRRLPSATWLTLAFSGGTGLSRGTATTMLENVARGGAIRRGGKITRVPAAWRQRDIDFGDRTRHVVTLPWGDVSTAFHSTGIPNIEVYTAATPATIRGMIVSRYSGWLLATKPMQSFFKDAIKKSGPAGPSDAQRASTVARLWGEAWDDDGNKVVSRLKTLDGYTLTALAAVAAAEKVLAGGTKPGFQTPSLAFGADFILEIPGSEREDVTVTKEPSR